MDFFLIYKFKFETNFLNLIVYFQHINSIVHFIKLLGRIVKSEQFFLIKELTGRMVN